VKFSSSRVALIFAGRTFKRGARVAVDVRQEEQDSGCDAILRSRVEMREEASMQSIQNHELRQANAPSGVSRGTGTSVAVESSMPERTIREQILQALEDLPPDATFDDAIERLVFLAKIDEGLAELDAGKGTPHDEVKRRLGL
jgi:predicted transcriptional regulator